MTMNELMGPSLAQPVPKRRKLRAKMRPYGNVFVMRLRNIRALLYREYGRQSEGSFGFAGTFIEPLALIIGLSLLRMEMHGEPPLGSSMVLFFLQGVVIFYTFNKTESGVAKAIHKNRQLLNFTVLAPMDFYFTSFLANFINMMILYHVCLLLHNFAVAEAFPTQVIWPEDILRVYQAMILAGVYGLVLGIMNSAIEEFFPQWDKIFGIVRRIQYIASGKMFVVDFMPTNIRELFAWNPLLHLVELARSGFYSIYESKTMDMNYLYLTLIFFALLALAIDKAAEKKRSVEA
jgi:capsular polysaccharide transport system permease protein